MERGLLEKVKRMRGKSSYRKIAAVAKNNEVAHVASPTKVNPLKLIGCTANSGRTGLTALMAVIILNTFPPSMATMWWKYLCLNFKVWRRSEELFSASPGCLAQKSVIFKAFLGRQRFCLTVWWKRAAIDASRSFVVGFWGSGSFYFTCTLMSSAYRPSARYGCCPNVAPALWKQMSRRGGRSLRSWGWRNVGDA